MAFRIVGTSQKMTHWIILIINILCHKRINANRFVSVKFDGEKNTTIF